MACHHTGHEQPGCEKQEAGTQDPACVDEGVQPTTDSCLNTAQAHGVRTGHESEDGCGSSRAGGAHCRHTVALTFDMRTLSAARRLTRDITTLARLRGGHESISDFVMCRNLASVLSM